MQLLLFRMKVCLCVGGGDHVFEGGDDGDDS